MNVLSVSSEIYPLIKTGGLADVTGALPIALEAYGVRTRTLIPGYPAVKAAVTDPVKCFEFTDLLGEKADLLEVQHEGLDLLILDAPAYYERSGGPYLGQTGKDYPDNWKRFRWQRHESAPVCFQAGGRIWCTPMTGRQR